MATKKTSATDSLRKLALLWGSQTEAGRSGLTVKAIVETAMEIADSDGLGAISMRLIAERLKVGTMSLYTHISSKEDVLDLMFDAVYAKLYDSIDEPSQQARDWRDAMRFVARRNWELYLAHPWILQLQIGRPVVGPNISIKYETELRPLDNVGLDDIEMDNTLTLILTHVDGCARAYINLNQARTESGVSDVEWWVEQVPLLNTVMNDMDFTVSGRVGETVGKATQSAGSPESVFVFGLERILAGVEALIASK